MKAEKRGGERENGTGEETTSDRDGPLSEWVGINRCCARSMVGDRPAEGQRDERLRPRRRKLFERRSLTESHNLFIGSLAVIYERFSDVRLREYYDVSNVIQISRQNYFRCRNVPGEGFSSACLICESKRREN